jgi:hypothetical protein
MTLGYVMLAWLWGRFGNAERSKTKTRVPKKSEFPPGTRFVILEFNVPLAQIPRGERAEWVNWFGGAPRPYDVTWLKVDNNWAADSFEEWTALVEASIPK